MASGKRHVPWRPAGCVALAALLAACTDSPPAPAAATVRDSAGIRIVEHPAGALAELPEWRVSAEPAVSIGGSPDAADDLNEVVGGYLAPDGAIVYADGAAHEIRLHGSDGTHIRSLGRRGSGPGEFSNITSIWQRGDSTAVYDMSAKRLSVLAHDGSPPRIAVLRHTGFLTWVQGSADGRLITRRLDLDALSGVGAATVRVPEHVMVLSADGSATDTILTIPGSAFYLPSESPGWEGPASLGLGPESALLVLGDSIVIGTNQSYELAIHDLAGRAVRIIRLAAPARSVEELDIERARQAAWEEFAPRAANMPPEIVTRFRSFLADQRYAEHFPFYGTLAADHAGNLWVQEYPDGAVGERFTIIGRDGTLVARVTLPDGLHFLAAGDGRVLGVWRDADGVQQLRVHTLTR